MIRLSNIHSLSDFTRNTKSHVARLRKTGEPEILTVNGQAQVVVQDADSYQKLLELAGLQSDLELTGVSLRQAKEGKSVPAEQVFREMRSALRATSR